jgi:hypothetical protein
MPHCSLGNVLRVARCIYATCHVVTSHGARLADLLGARTFPLTQPHIHSSQRTTRSAHTRTEPRACTHGHAHTCARFHVRTRTHARRHSSLKSGVHTLAKMIFCCAYSWLMRANIGAAILHSQGGAVAVLQRVAPRCDGQLGGCQLQHVDTMRHLPACACMGACAAASDLHGGHQLA